MEHTLYLNLDIFCVHEEYRKKGYGTIGYNVFEEYAKNKNFKAIILHCAPKESYSFWKSFRYKDLDSERLYQPELSLYKSLINQMQCSNDASQKYRNQIFYDDYRARSGNNPDKQWSFDYTSELKETPILIPCHYDSAIQVFENNKEIVSNRVKYFSSKQKITDFPFVFIDDLNLDR